MYPVLLSFTITHLHAAIIKMAPFAPVAPFFGVFQLIRCSSGYKEKDGKVYFNGEEITDKSFVVLNDAFARDSTTAYYKSKSFQYADVATFKVLGENYGSDSRHVFYKINIVKGVDPASFKVYPHDVGNADTEDAGGKFHEGKKVVDDE